MKQKIYIKIGKGSKATPQISVTKTPSYAPMEEYDNGSKRFIPTVSFAVNLDIPDHLFKSAEKEVATINVTKKNAVVCVEVDMVDQ